MRWTLACLALLASSRMEAQQPPASNQPRVCLASFDKGSVKLRYYSGIGPYAMTFKGTEKNEKGETVEFTYAIERRSLIEQMLVLDGESVEVYTPDGKQLDSSELAALLAKEPRVLAFSKKPDADTLKIVKKGSLLLVVPVSMDTYTGPVGPAAVQ